MEEKFDYHIFGMSSDNAVLDKNMRDKIVEEIYVYMQEGKSIPSYYMDNLRETSYEMEALVASLQKTIRQVDKGIFCAVYYPPEGYNRRYHDVLFILWDGKVKDILGVQSYKGMIVEEEIISIFSSHMESYGTVYGRINIERNTLKYWVKKAEFQKAFRWDWKDTWLD